MTNGISAQLSFVGRTEHLSTDELPPGSRSAGWPGPMPDGRQVRAMWWRGFAEEGRGAFAAETGARMTRWPDRCSAGATRWMPLFGPGNRALAAPAAEPGYLLFGIVECHEKKSWLNRDPGRLEVIRRYRPVQARDYYIARDGNLRMALESPGTRSLTELVVPSGCRGELRADVQHNPDEPPYALRRPLRASMGYVYSLREPRVRAHVIEFYESTNAPTELLAVLRDLLPCLPADVPASKPQPPQALSSPVQLPRRDGLYMSARGSSLGFLRFTDPANVTYVSADGEPQQIAHWLRPGSERPGIYQGIYRMSGRALWFTVKSLDGTAARFRGSASEDGSALSFEVENPNATRSSEVFKFAPVEFPR
ncbi:hypothetical protein [Streptomyces murinus]|uniref:hypothetical protein n=2 Tax=Streptomyces murinus TaxID=33900 RepID=UPI00117C1259|nr:hypothetical protein [Streptomyces murinus]